MLTKKEQAKKDKEKITLLLWILFFIVGAIMVLSGLLIEFLGDFWPFFGIAIALFSLLLFIPSLIAFIIWSDLKT